MRVNSINGVLIATLLSCAMSGGLRAQEEERQVEVQRVTFNRNASLTGDSRRWFETVVELNVGTPAGEDVLNPRFVDDIEVSLYLSFDVSRGSVSLTRFYRASVEIITLERGRRQISFFLPPEVVARDRITTDPMAYLVDLSVDGVRQELVSNAHASLLNDESVRQSFLNRIESAAGVNDGILLPIHQTPFVNERQYLQNVPSRRHPDGR